ncbi:hypothetical protein VitviT2T_011004 [Vitis vinifera]|uniref:Uncharacterized protein n=1 Tax=Vitis vinifera TaxID=29760 RepID=A0ABY9CAI2_VITVI|nr:hypothetical protein VitviT2T_011004 [Vitis vinifera]
MGTKQALVLALLCHPNPQKGVSSISELHASGHSPDDLLLKLPTILYVSGSSYFPGKACSPESFSAQASLISGCLRLVYFFSQNNLYKTSLKTQYVPFDPDRSLWECAARLGYAFSQPLH